MYRSFSALVAAALACAAPLAEAACDTSRSIPLQELERTAAYSSVEYPQAGEHPDSASLKAELKIDREVRDLIVASLQAGCQQSIEWTENAGYDLYTDEYKDASASFWSASKVVLHLANGGERVLRPTFSMQGGGQNLSSSDRVEFNRAVVLSRSALGKLHQGATLAVSGEAQTRAFIALPAPWEYATSFVNFVDVPRLVIRLP